MVVITAHKAKGLEWDRVYLMSVNNYDFPSAQPGDTFISERWFVRDRLNLQAEALAQMEALAAEAPLPPLGEATDRRASTTRRSACGCSTWASPGRGRS